ncbi:MAG: S1C family serine protease [Actinomycetales bacterium]
MSAPTPTYGRQDQQVAGSWPETGNPYAPRHEQVTRPKRRVGAVIGILAGALVIGLGAGVAGGAVGYLAARDDSPQTLITALQERASTVSSGTASVADVAAAVQPAVVQLDVEAGQQSGTGSGFVITADGYIVTNNHVAGVAGDSGTIEVSFSDGKTATGKLVGASPDYDLAVVKVDRTGLATVPLGSSADLVVGDPVIAVGSPLGLQGTVTTGIISALNRPVTVGEQGDTSFINAVQTDAAINPGNSGGPLVNASGAVVGVNSAIASMSAGGDQAGSIGLGFAIPIDTAKRIAQEIIANGSAATPIIGVSLDTNFEGPGGKVAEITNGGPADTAGLQVDDVIVKVNGETMADSTQLIVTIRSQAPGDRVTLTIERDGERQDLALTLGSATE